MKEISKFIPMDGNVEEQAKGLGGFGENNMEGYTDEKEGTSWGTQGNDTTWGNKEGETTWENNKEDTTFKVCSNPTNLPAKQKGFFSKLKAILFYEIKVELTPYQQKVENEINEFLHQEITWKGFKNFLFQDISFSKKNKNK